ncbi:hypothetical protein HYDPIDRAFT_113288 [Hydnomerulius pinastri MD-312]|uniref:DUF6534 domain-containing protein n=1 Tax=Hydnomerulius pinastri MD-312 TaxID=994086 RepID=A0A0C9VYA4_9AGAM|nr:hypothetical protein HYDPIDRAFT_113288 [Hydnomerulius pinastri MD-312]
MATMINSAGEIVVIGEFYAAMYWGFVLSTSFVGISLVQGYMYFMKNNKDRWSMKALVISLLIFDPATSVLMAETIYYYFVINFGVDQALASIPASWVVENGLTALVTSIVQVYFATRIYIINKRVGVLPFDWVIPALVFVCAFGGFVAGTVRTILIGIWTIDSFSRPKFQSTVILEETFGLASDILATCSLCYILAPSRTGTAKRSSRLKTLFMFTINRAILVTIVQVGMLASYLVARAYLYWMPFHLCKSKLYTNTLLAMLNSREGGGLRVEAPSRPPWSMPIINLTVKDDEGAVGDSMSTDDVDTEKDARPEEQIAELERSTVQSASSGPS